MESRNDVIPGDIIFTGFPPGAAMRMKANPAWSRDGDVMVARLENIGTVRNTARCLRQGPFC